MNEADGTQAPLFKAAIWCGAVPLLAGSLVFWVWLPTRWDWLMIAGLWILAAGLVLFLMGNLCLRFHIRRQREMFPDQEVLWRRPYRLASVLLLANLPAAAIYAGAGIYLSSTYLVEVRNDSAKPVDAILLLGPGVREEIGPIPSGGSSSSRF